jgi:ATP/maltotriose-dependent transcriptional regulator MalT/DNA-binding SARP family transcriptional activator
MPTLAKLTRPKTHRALPRERLFDHLDEARQRPLVWIASPPGAGKTTLVSSYIESRKLKALWFQVDAGDTDIGTFFHYLARALPAGRREPELPQFLPAHRADLPAFCRHFFRALYSRAAAPPLLVLDNYHELAPEAPLHGLLEQIVAEVPEQHSILAISRAEPPRELAPLRLNGRLAITDWSVLRMSMAETRAMAEAQAVIDERSMQRIHQLTGGWAAGVALSVQRLRDAGGEQRDATTDDSEALFDYFATQLLRQATPELRHFLLHSAVLPILTADTANAITGRTDAAEQLEDLHRRGLFTSRRGTRPPSYQYHDLFRSFLLAQLEAQVPAQPLRELRRRAGALLEQGGHIDHAIRLYLKVQDWPDARRALQQAATSLLAQNRSESLREWIEALPPEFAADPWMDYWLGAATARLAPPAARVPLARAWKALEHSDDIVLKRLVCADMILTFAFEYSDFAPLDYWGSAMLQLLEQEAPFLHAAGEMHVLNACLFALGQRLPRAAQMQRCTRRIFELMDRADIPAELAIVAAGFQLVQHFSLGTLREATGIVRRLEELLQKPDLSPMAVTMTHIQLGHMAIRSGEHERARVALKQGQEVARANALNLPMLFVFSNLGLAFDALQRGDLAAAEQYRKAMEQATVPERKLDQIGILRVRAWIACHRGQWDLAHALAEQHLGLANEYGLFVVMFECHMLQAYLCAQTRRAAQLEGVLAQVESLIAGTAYEHFGYQLDMARAYHALLSGNQKECHVALARGLAASRADDCKFMLRMQPLVLPRLLGEALVAGIDTGYARQLIAELEVPPPPEQVEAWPWPIRIYTLGKFEVQKQDAPLEFSRKAPKKTLALLKVLIAEGGVNVREQRLLDALWADEEGDVQARSLTAALHRLRGLLGDNEAVLQSGGTLSLNPSRVWVDALALDERLGGTKPASAEWLLGLYRGTFLKEDEAEPWTVTTRERLRSRFIHALGVETGRLEREGRFDLAIECYLRGIDADPVIEPFYQGLMRCYAATGRRAEAVAAYRRVKHILSVALSLKPSASTEKLHQSLRLEPG